MAMDADGFDIVHKWCVCSHSSSNNSDNTWRKPCIFPRGHKNTVVAVGSPAHIKYLWLCVTATQGERMEGGGERGRGGGEKRGREREREGWRCIQRGINSSACSRTEFSIRVHGCLYPTLATPPCSLPTPAQHHKIALLSKYRVI